MNPDEITPPVSIIIPVYNRVDTIRRAVDSALNQTYENLEVIVVDDGSTDGTREVLKSIETDEKDVRVQYQNSNQGANAARNAGIKKSIGELISFLDSDDELQPQYIRRIVDVFQQYGNDIGLVFTSYRKFKNGDLIDVTRGHNGRLSRDRILATNRIGSFSAITVHRFVFDEIELLDEQFVAAQDYELYVRLTRHYGVVGLDEPLVDRHLEESRIETSVQRRRQGYKTVKEKFGDEIPRERTADFHNWTGHILGNSHNISESRQEFAKAIYYNPVDWRNYYFLFATFFGYRGFSAAKRFKNRLNIWITSAN